MPKPSKQILRALLLASGLLLLCIVLRPSGLAANDGLSYFGIWKTTLIPYAAALLIYEYSLWKTSEALGHSRKSRLLAIALKLMSVLVIGILVTPISVVEDFHSLIGLVLFAVQLIVSFKLLSWGLHWIDAGLVIIEVLSFSAGVYFASFEDGLLLQSQVVFQLAFVALLVRSVSLLRAKSKTPAIRDQQDRVQAEELLAQTSRSSEDFFKLWPPDKRYFWSTNKDAFVAYKVLGSIAFAIADPIAHTEASAQAVLQEFLTHCRAQKWRVCFILATDESKPLYEQAKMRVITMGASALIDIQEFMTKTSTDKWWRWQQNKGQELGYQYEYHAQPQPLTLLAELRHVSEAWLEDSHHREQGFMLGYFDEDYLQRCAIHLLRDKQGEVVAFANELPVFNHLPRATTDLMRVTPDTPHAMPYLMLKLLQQLQQNGHVAHFDLGFVPLAQMHGLLARMARTLGAHRFSAAGLEQFKNKFDPTWQPNYLAYAGDLADLAHIAINLEKAVDIDDQARYRL